MRCVVHVWWCVCATQAHSVRMRTCVRVPARFAWYFDCSHVYPVSASELKTRFDAIVTVPPYTDPALEAHVRALESGALSTHCRGVSHHDLIFSAGAIKETASEEVVEAMSRTMAKREPVAGRRVPSEAMPAPVALFTDSPQRGDAAAAAAGEGDEEGVVDLVGDAARRRSTAVWRRRSLHPDAKAEAGAAGGGGSGSDCESEGEECVEEFRALDPEGFDAAAHPVLSAGAGDGSGAVEAAVLVASPPAAAEAILTGAALSPYGGGGGGAGVATPASSCDTPIIQCVGIPVTPPPRVAGGEPPVVEAAAAAPGTDTERELYQWAVAAGQDAVRSGRHAEALAHLLDALDIDASDLSVQALARDVGHRVFSA